MFADFLAFLVVLELMWPQVSTLRVLAFMEHLHGHGMSPSNINNYLLLSGLCVSSMARIRCLCEIKEFLCLSKL